MKARYCERWPPGGRDGPARPDRGAVRGREGGRREADRVGAGDGGRHAGASPTARFHGGDPIDATGSRVRDPRPCTFAPGSRAGWSVLGDPGTFSVGAPLPWIGDVSDPRCTDFGGQDEGWTGRFRYAPYDNLIDAQQQTRAFAEINGPLSGRINYHVEGLGRRGVPELVHDAVVRPGPYAPHHHHGGGGRPSGPPGVSAAATLATRRPIRPGRAWPTPWYFHGRPFGNSVSGAALSSGGARSPAPVNLGAAPATLDAAVAAGARPRDTHAMGVTHYCRRATLRDGRPDGAPATWSP